MLRNLKRLLTGNRPTNDTEHKALLGALVAELGEPDHVDRDSDRLCPIDIYAFGRNFIEECEGDTDDDEGYVLFTCGMSDTLMHAPETAEEEPRAVELIWYVRDLDPSYFANLRWLARLPNLDKTWLGIGHTVPVPHPPLPFCDFQCFFLLPPVARTDRHLFQGLDSQGEQIATLAVHLISQAEYELVKTSDGLDQFLDLLDQNDYPRVFDPKRTSYV